MAIKARSIFLSDDGNLHAKYAEIDRESIHNIRSHNHLLCEILYLVDGDANYHIEGRNYKLRKYDLIFTRPGKNHYLSFNSSSVPYRRFNIICHHSYFPEELYNALSPDADVINFENNENVRGIFEKLEFYSENLDHASCEKLFASLMCELFCHFAIAARNPENRLPPNSNPTLEAALKYIDKNLSRIGGIEEVCSALFITKSYLHHLFKTSMKITPKRYINQKRLLLARRKIRHGRGPVEVYRECGFSDYTTFYRNYKSYFGYEPRLEGSASPQITTPPMDF